VTSIFHGIGIFLLSFSISMALGVAFGLCTSLMLKHSYLHLYPSIESCLVALSAYTCYFFSNGLSMSGIVSLLFCGITLKHYAYHTMSRRTQRASKYIFSTLAQLSENFIFIYLGMSLFTSAPVSEPVFSYVKPAFIVITLIAVVFTRYAAVFPLSEAINFFHRHARGQRHEEIPHSYQMMLFWAGLRGAVGVALAAGFKGSNAQMMRTTVLIVVVLTVVLFGGTTARMLEVLGIRTGVEDETGVSSDEEESLPPPTRSAWTSGNGRRWYRFYEDESTTAVPPTGAARVGIHYGQPRLYNHHHQHSLPPLQVRNQNVPHALFSASSSDSYDSDVADVLPLAPTSLEANNPSSHEPHPNTQIPANPSLSRMGEDGKWFQTIDERYLLPIFSNATASRTFHARRARRSAGPSSITGSAMNTPVDSEDEIDISGQDVESGSPTPGGAGGRPLVTRSISVDESRIERGLRSPVMRSSSGNGSSEGGRYS
jgi:sodium/hydrogen exchanger-like protein 6/7